MSLCNVGRGTEEVRRIDVKAIMVMFDSLNRRFLPPYGNDWVNAPNFQRLAERTVTFDNYFIGSMPCMPARRELHTGRYNFLHRSWGPLEPFDDSMPAMLNDAGVHTHLVSDHHHYWEDGGGGFHERYTTFDYIRGQEGDPWIGQVEDPYIPPSVELPSRMGGRTISTYVRQDWVNRAQIHGEGDFPITHTFDHGLEFMDRNCKEDNWFLQIETFDPHEPFHSADRYKSLYPDSYDGKHFDWPPYGDNYYSEEEVQHLVYEYAELVSMCDDKLGRFLDKMDELELWDDTLLIVNTDHGFMLGEHNQLGKNVPPYFNEVAHIPLFIWDPRCRKCGERRKSLVQMIDMAPTILDYFGLPATPDMQGRNLKDTIANDAKVHDAVLFGLHGGSTNCTDGRYVYMRHWDTSKPIYEYTITPENVQSRMPVEELQQAELVAPFSFTKGVPVLKVPGTGKGSKQKVIDSVLYDLENDYAENEPIDDPEVEQMMIDHMVRLMKETDAPVEQYDRMGLTEYL